MQCILQTVTDNHYAAKGIRTVRQMFGRVSSTQFLVKNAKGSFYQNK